MSTYLEQLATDEPEQPAARTLAEVFGLGQPAPAEYSAPNRSRQSGAMGERFQRLFLGDIAPDPHNPRKAFDPEALAELAESIRVDGLLEPILVRPNPGRGSDSALHATGPRWLLVAGERRWRAARLAGLTMIDAQVRADLDEKQALRLALVENLQRKDLDPIEVAEGYARLNREVGLTQAAIAESVNRSQPAVANTMRLLDLPEDVRERISKGELTVAHGVALARWKEYPEFVSGLARLAVAGSWTSKRLEAFTPDDYEVAPARRYLLQSRDSAFDPSVCDDCPFQARWSGKNGYPYCLKPSHFDELNAAAKQAHAEAEATRVEAILAATGAPVAPLLKLAELGHANYRQLATVPPGCGADCPCRSRVLDYSNRECVVCTDPQRYDKFAEAEKRAKQQAARDEKAARLAAALAAVDRLSTGEAAKGELVLLVESLIGDIGGSRIAILRSALQRQAPRLDADTLTGYHQGREGKRFRALALLSERQLLRLGIELLLRRDIEYQYEQYRVGGHVADWYLKHSQAEPTDTATVEP